VIRRLSRAIPAAPGKPIRAGAEQTQRFARDLAADPALWTPEQARQTVRSYADLAADWDEERGRYRLLPVADALSRGGPYPPGPAIEVGSGTGLLTEMLATLWQPVLCADLSPDMLIRSPARYRVRADASRLPIRAGLAAAVILADVPLFAAEVIRVLAPRGVVLWANALGTGAPHHVPVAEVLAALERADPGRSWATVTAEAGWGLWAVLRSRPATG
jgi:SAM-dependent methyltransferase